MNSRSIGPKMLRRIWASKLGLLFLLVVALLAPAVAAASDAVTEWTLLADSYGNGAANWRTQALMHRAMHDALNAARPTYARWDAAMTNEPSASGALPEAAMAAAARRVLLLLHSDRKEETDRYYNDAISRYAAGPGRDAGVELGDYIGFAAVISHLDDGFATVRSFAAGSRPGDWRPAPQKYLSSATTAMHPFLFDLDEPFRAPPPPAIDTDAYRAALAEVRRIGGAVSADRTQAQSDTAVFWASQNSQRGYINLTIRLLDDFPPRGLFAHARIMSQLTTALADSAIMTWHEKEFFNYWRPVTAIRTGSPGVAPDPTWLPLVDTPPFPEYPSGHAADCYTGSAVIQAAFGADLGAITYVAQQGIVPANSLSVSMGQHPQAPERVNAARRFESVAASADECANSRIWAGAHFRPADVEAHRLGDMIGAKAAAAVPPLK